MTERQLKALILFFLETIIILGGKIMSEDFATAFNEFIYEQYKHDHKSLSIIFNIDILRKSIEKNYDILTVQQITQLVYLYPGIDNYIKLVEEIGIEEDKKINYLALLFSIQYQQRIKLRFADTSMYYPKGFPKIKQ